MVFEKVKERVERWKAKIQEERALRKEEKGIYKETYEEHRAEARLKAAKEAGRKRAYAEARARYRHPSKRKLVYKPYGARGKLGKIKSGIIKFRKEARKLPIVQQTMGIPPKRKKKRKKKYNPFDMTTW